MKRDRAVEAVGPFRVALWLALTLSLALPTAGRAAAEGVECPAEPVDMSISYGQLINCTIESGDSDIFRFSGIAKENIVLLVAKTPTSSLRPCLELIAPDNGRTTSCANAFSQRIDKTLNLTGTYTILVSSFSFSGPYTLALERVALPSSTARAIQYGQTLTDEINPDGDLDLFYLGGGVGDSMVLTVTKTPTSSLRPCLELIAPDNSRSTSCGNAFSQRIDITLTKTGTYTVLVSSFSFGGAYSLTLQCVSAFCSESTTLFVPIILSAAGLNNSFFSSEIVFTNRGPRDTVMDFNYVAAFAGGTSTASAPLPAGRQSIVADAIAHLRSLGMPIPGSGNRGGTLAVRFSGLSSASDAAVTVRTTTVVPEGRAGLAYLGLPPGSLLTGPAFLSGLRQNTADRSNVAVQNAGTGYDGSIVLRLTVFSGGSGPPSSFPLPDITLGPGEFYQVSGILSSNGLALAQGYVRVERVSGTAPYYAYAVVNDQANSDGSFVPPIPENAYLGRPALTLPVVVETALFDSELVLTNKSASRKTVRLAYVADAVQAERSTSSLTMLLEPGQQSILPTFVQYLRQNGTPAPGPPGPSFVGALFATVDGGDISEIILGARTSTLGGGGRYGLFYLAVPSGSAGSSGGWVYGLLQNAETRSNLALVNTGEVDDQPVSFFVELFNGNSGTRVGTFDVTVPARRWLQIGTVLATYAPGATQGYARVTRTIGSNPFIVYGVVNDGGQPGERSGDGAFVPGTYQ